MTSIITGDIINSRNIATEIWLTQLTSVLNLFGKNPTKWEIYRGDSFQLETSTTEAFFTCLLIKSSIKTIQGLDVRLAIGIGDKSFSNNNITQGNGSAFLNSGFAFDNYLKKYTLSLKSDNEELDEIFNTILQVALLTIDKWTVKSSELAFTVLQNKTLTQRELSIKLNVSQANISKTYNRAGLHEILKLNTLFKKLITKKLNV